MLHDGLDDNLWQQDCEQREKMQYKERENMCFDVEILAWALFVLCLALYRFYFCSCFVSVLCDSHV